MGSGGSPALKPPEERRNRTPPHQGEWITLPPAEGFEPVIPPYKRSFEIEKWMWDLWRADPVTSQWSSADLSLALDLAKRWKHLEPTEHRLRMTQLGMTPPGRRALRWRTPLEEKQQVEAAEKLRVHKLRLVGLAKEARQETKGPKKAS
jgi:hypothetical protein